MDHDASPNSDNDELSNLAEFIIGTSATNPDTDNDGVSDSAEIENRTDPLDGRGFPTGVIATLPLMGRAMEVVVEGSPLNAQEQLAYVATGSYGLAIVDATNFQLPIILGQLDLPGNNNDIATDVTRGLAVVASGAAGLHFVDVSDPMMPDLLETVLLPFGANRVEVFDGLAYVASGNNLISIELATGENSAKLSARKQYFD